MKAIFHYTITLIVFTYLSISTHPVMPILSRWLPYFQVPYYCRSIDSLLQWVKQPEVCPLMYGLYIDSLARPINQPSIGIFQHNVDPFIYAQMQARV